MALILSRTDNGYVFATSDRQVISEPFRAATRHDFLRELERFRRTLHPLDRGIPLSEESERFIEGMSH